MAPLTDALIAQIRSRAADPDRRTDGLPASDKTISVGKFAATTVDLQSLITGRPAAPRPASTLAPPVGSDEIAQAEARLGFPLPGEVRRLYSEVADGGFGPGPGLLPLDRVVETYLALMATPPGRRGQKWPAHLLPLTHTDPGHDCLDINTGQMVFWDEEDLADGASDKVWKRSFKPGAPDIATWFEGWVRTPSPEERMRATMQDAHLNAIRTSLAHWRAKTPAERAKFGLPEIGWEQKLFGHLGIDLSKL